MTPWVSVWRDYFARAISALTTAPVDGCSPSVQQSTCMGIKTYTHIHTHSQHDLRVQLPLRFRLQLILQGDPVFPSVLS